jgi:MATE family, multidrug efflux pump
VLAIPAGTGFFFNTMFNVVDTWYGGRISSEALAAMTLSFPLFFIIIAVASGISAGATALIGHALGAGDHEKAGRYAAQTLSFALFHGSLLTLAGIFAAPYIIPLMGASGAYLQMAVAYLSALYCGAPFFILNQALNSLLIATGDTRGFRNLLISGFFLNLVLDPWLLYGGFGIPPLGLPGIAWATVLVQGGGAFYLFLRVRRTGYLSGLSFRKLIPSRDAYFSLARLGFPASLNLLTVAVGFFIITWFMGRFSHAAVAAYGIATRIEQTVLLPVMGLNIATLALVARNFGARKYDRVRETFRFTITSGLAITIATTLLVWLFSPQLVRLFTGDTAVTSVGARYLRIESLGFAAYIILYISVSTLQGLQRPYYPLGIGIFRQFVAPAALFPLLAYRFGLGLTGIWWGIVSITWSAALFTLFYLRITLRNLTPASLRSPQR